MRGWVIDDLEHFRTRFKAALFRRPNHGGALAELFQIWEDIG